MATFAETNYSGDSALYLSAVCGEQLETSGLAVIAAGEVL